MSVCAGFCAAILYALAESSIHQGTAAIVALGAVLFALGYALIVKSEDIESILVEAFFDEDETEKGTELDSIP